MSTYRGDSDKTKCMFVLIKDEKSLKNYNEIWEKVSNIIKKDFGSKPIYNRKYLKTKMKFCKGKINTKQSSQCIYISVILIDSVYRKYKNYYLQVLLEKYKYIVKKF